MGTEATEVGAGGGSLVGDFAALKEYLPQPVEWFRDKETQVFAAFLGRWPTLQEVESATDEAFVGFLPRAPCRSVLCD